MLKNKDCLHFLGLFFLWSSGPRFIKSFFSDKMVFERQNGFSASKIWLMGFSVKIRVS